MSRFTSGTFANNAEELFRLAVESSPSAMVMVDQEGNIVVVNRQAERLFGYRREELLGQQVHMLVPDSFRADHPRLREGFYSNPVARPMGAGRDLYAQRKDGSQVPVEIGLNPIETKEGTWVLSAIVDISERKRAMEAQLSESEDRFRNMADTAPVMIWVSGPDKKCTFVNKGWLEFRGRTLEEELGDGWADGIHPDDVQRCLRTYRQLFDARQRCQVEYRLRRADGKYRWILDTGVPRFESDGAFAGYVGSCVDITDFKRAQEDELAQQKLESLGLLARGVAHDFNNLQSIIIMLSEAMLENLDANSEPAKDIEQIRNIAMRSAELTHQLRIYAGGDVGTVESVDVTSVVEEMLKLLEVSIAKRAVLTHHLAKGLPPVLANASHIRQIVLNLVINAAEAMDETKPGVIEVATAQISLGNKRAANMLPGEYLRLAVSDNGHGIPKELRTKIFDPFFTTKATGRGLGLSVVHGTVRRYGGSFEVYSSPKLGTRFEIVLPFAARLSSSSAKSGR